MIETKGLVKKFGVFTALDNLNIHVEKGSIYGLIGVNGSGKTTLIKTLTGILVPDSGEVLIDGKKSFDNEDLKQRIGFIPDELYFYGNYSLNSMAGYYSRLYRGWDWDRYKDMCCDFGLPEKTRISKFSKGMQKQAAFILCMSHFPDILILDEPIDGLDPIVRKKVWKYVVADVADREMTVLVSSHNLREMEGICDYIGILSSGTMRIERGLEELTGDTHKIQVAFPQNESGAFVSDKEKLISQLNVLHRESRGSVDMLIVRGDRNEIENVLRRGSPVVLDILPLSLEEVFIYEMGGANNEIGEILQ